MAWLCKAGRLEECSLDECSLDELVDLGYKKNNLQRQYTKHVFLELELGAERDLPMNFAKM